MIARDFCLLIPCYNNPEGLVRSLQSVYYRADRFLILVIDDGSDAPISQQILQSKLQRGYSVSVIRNEENKGITYSLNIGLDWIRNNAAVKYIARLDCSDECAEERFYKQVAYLENHDEIGLLGSWCIFENREKTSKHFFRTPTGHQSIERAMHFRNVFIHPAVMFRTDLLEITGFYPYGFNHAEDYALFWRLIRASQSAVLSEFLVTCELNEKGISHGNRPRQLLSRIKVVYRYGSNPFLVFLGILWTAILLLIPYRLLLKLKTLKRP